MEKEQMAVETPSRVTVAQVDKMKRRAKSLRKSDGIPHHEALDTVAVAAGYASWQAVTLALARADLIPAT